MSSVDREASPEQTLKGLVTGNSQYYLPNKSVHRVLIGREVSKPKQSSVKRSRKMRLDVRNEGGISLLIRIVECAKRELDLAQTRDVHQRGVEVSPLG